jgi:hypothetical protein
MEGPVESDCIVVLTYTRTALLSFITFCSAQQSSITMCSIQTTTNRMNCAADRGFANIVLQNTRPIGIIDLLRAESRLETWAHLDGLL